MIRFALLGCGRIGAMRAHDLATAPPRDLYSCRVAESPEDALGDVDAVLIATSTPTLLTGYDELKGVAFIDAVVACHDAREPRWTRPADV